MKTVFVTGAEGFTGRHLSEFLKQRGCEVVGGVRNRARKLAFEKQFGKAIVCEVSDGINVARAIASVKPDVVVHLAGVAQELMVADDPLAAYQSSVTAWANILDAVRRSCSRAKVVLGGSWEVYGDATSSGQPCSETTACKPSGALGSFKANAEAVASTFFRNFHLNICIARPFTYTGAGQSEFSFFGGLAQRIAGSSTPGSSIKVPNWSAKWDVLHVSDVVEAYWKLIEDGKPNEIYNICSGKTQSVEQCCQTLARACGKSVSFENGGGSSGTICGSNDKLRSLGWQPTRTVESALTDLARSVTTRMPVAAAA